MLIKFFKNGQGGGTAPVEYLIADKVLAYDDNRNLLRNAFGKSLLKKRDPLPEVLVGNPEHTKLLIDGSRHKWSYRAGVLSFDKADNPTEKQQRDTMTAFEKLAYAGLERDQYDILWVRHTHEDRIELHFCTPRSELSTRNSLNIAPPGYIKAMDALRDMLNKEHGWVDPQDPSRARETKHISEQKERASSRKEIQYWLEDQIVAGRINNRPEMIETLQSAGFEIPRTGKTYLTVKDPETDIRWRLKGTLFHEGWTRENTAQRALESQHARRTAKPSRLDDLSLSELRERYQSHVDRRSEYNRERFGRAAQSHQQRHRARAKGLERAVEAASPPSSLVTSPTPVSRRIFSVSDPQPDVALGNQLPTMAGRSKTGERVFGQQQRILDDQPEERQPRPLRPQPQQNHLQGHTEIIHGNPKPTGARAPRLREAINRSVGAFQHRAKRLGETFDRFAYSAPGRPGGLLERLNQLTDSIQRGLNQLADRTSELRRTYQIPQQDHDFNRKHSEQVKPQRSLSRCTQTNEMER
ncbi:relaxase/mobilization nuclease domain-containing protein [Pseudovibrio sp. WM33]|uniref:relaxase/mobilization nuclease domain-containing protein n=1 Tax=Pseudovibrio sp. WM33 TaxID=1735585 RepID=UPI0007AE3C4E|nr:relaxase/mobilization nuclease domain-containing protein [Pseudovibrio sp. WM33]KZL24701.1 DNA relaxase MbeA [Pseudovibrio sp. WM33]